MVTMKKTQRQRPRAADPLGHGVPVDACPSCGAKMRRARGRFAETVNGEEVAVASIPHLRCPKCDEVLLSLDQCRLISREAFAIYRQKYLLLAPAEIRAIRMRFGLTQAELGQLLRLGSNTISRWEADRVVQSASLDVLLRLIRDIPGSMRYLRRRAA
jgi:putative zinc finger/helix-turn-helix YgiT family protein